jgi:hypothetical protein
MSVLHNCTILDIIYYSFEKHAVNSNIYASYDETNFQAVKN